MEENELKYSLGLKIPRKIVILIASPGLLGKPGLILMAYPRACLFVDGSNFYHGLKENGLYAKFKYESLIKVLSTRYDIKNIFFYDALKNIQIEPSQYAKQQSFHASLKKSIPNLLVRTRKLQYVFSNHKLEKAQQKANFCKQCNPKIKSFLFNAGLNRSTKEKGIDVLLVADMIKGAFQNQYDVALIASGDADFVPAVELVQVLKKKVVNIHMYAGSSSELRNTCNAHLLVQLDDNVKIYLT